LHLRFSCNLFSQCRVDKYFVQMARLLVHLYIGAHIHGNLNGLSEAEAKSRATRSPKTEPNAARLFLQLVVRWMGQHCVLCAMGCGCVPVVLQELNTCRKLHKFDKSRGVVEVVSRRKKAVKKRWCVNTRLSFAMGFLLILSCEAVASLRLKPA